MNKCFHTRTYLSPDHIEPKLFEIRRRNCASCPRLARHSNLTKQITSSATKPNFISLWSIYHLPLRSKTYGPFRYQREYHSCPYITEQSEWYARPNTTYQPQGTAWWRGYCRQGTSPSHVGVVCMRRNHAGLHTCPIVSLIEVPVGEHVVPLLSEIRLRLGRIVCLHLQLVRFSLREGGWEFANEHTQKLGRWHASLCLLLGFGD